MQDTNIGKLWAGGKEVYGNSVLSAQFFCKLKNALGNKAYFLK